MSDERDLEKEQQMPKYEHYQLQQKEDTDTLPETSEILKKKYVKKKENAGFGKKLASTAVLAVVFGLISGVTFQGVDYAAGKQQQKENYVTLEKTQVSTASYSGQSANKKEETEGMEAGTVADVAGNVMPCVVAITTVSVQEIPSFYGFGYRMREYSSTGSGSGIIVGENEEELLIATNNHVIDGASTLSVCFMGDETAEAADFDVASNDGDINVEDAVSAKIKGTDPENDLAVISVKKEEIPEETMQSIKIAQIGVSDSLVVGEQVVAIGNALGYGQSVTSGWISALNRTVTLEDGYSADLIQTDAAINPGNSGGPLLNMYGELIGINSAKYADDAVEGMGYAIPISKAEPILEELMNRKTREKVDEEKVGYLGVEVMNLSQEAIQMYNMPQGAFIMEAIGQSAAEKAGLRKGDIIVQMDGQKIQNGDELIEKLAYYEAGETIEIVVARADRGEYREVSLDVELGSKSGNES